MRNKLIPIFLSLIQLATGTLFAHVPEQQFWSDRQARQRALKNLSTSESAPHPASSLGQKTVFYLQDLHLNTEAQWDIAKKIEKISNAKSIGLIGLEGAFGPLHVENFRSYPDQQAVGLVALYLLYARKLSGAVYSALSNRKNNALMMGVDDKKMYRSHVQAYRNALKTHSQNTRALKKHQNECKRTFISLWNTDLQSFHNTLQSYHSGHISFEAYIAFLAQHAPAVPASLNTAIELTQFERSFSEPLIKEDLRKYITQLTANLSPHELGILSHLKQDRDSQMITDYEFVNRLSMLSARHKLPIKAMPYLSSWFRFLEISNTLDVRQLIEDCVHLEKDGYRRKAKTLTEQSSIDHVLYAGYLDKLIRLSMTSLDWADYKTLRQSLPRDKRDPDGMILEFHHQFYKDAELRDQKMAFNLIEAMKTKNISNAILITGGFHRQGIEAFLSKENIRTVVMTPHVKNPETWVQPHDLSFLPQKTLLEKALSKTALLLVHPAGPSVLSMAAVQTVATGLIGNSNDTAATAQTRLDELMDSPAPSIVAVKHHGNSATVVVETNNSANNIGVHVERSGNTINPAEKPVAKNFWRSSRMMFRNFGSTKRISARKAWQSFKLPLLFAAAMTAQPDQVMLKVVRLAWNPNPAADNVSFYHLYMAPTPDGPFQRVGSTTEITFQIAVPVNQFAVFAVRASNTSGESNNSNLVGWGPSRVVPTRMQIFGSLMIFEFSYINVKGAEYLVETTTNPGDPASWVSVGREVRVISRSPFSNSDMESVVLRGIYPRNEETRLFRIRFHATDGIYPPSGGMMIWLQNLINQSLSKAGIRWTLTSSHYRWHSTWIENSLAYLTGGLLYGLLTALPITTSLQSGFAFYNILSWLLFVVGHTRWVARQFDTDAPKNNLKAAALIAAMNIGLGFSGLSPLAVIAMSVATHAAVNAATSWSVLSFHDRGTPGLRILSERPAFPTLSGTIDATTLPTLADNVQQTPSPSIVMPFISQTQESAVTALEHIVTTYDPGRFPHIHIEAVVDNPDDLESVQQWISASKRKNVHVLLRQSNETMKELEAEMIRSEHVSHEDLSRSRFQLLVSPNTPLSAGFLNGISESDLSRYDFLVLVLIETLNAIAVRFGPHQLNNFKKFAELIMSQA